MGISEKRRQRYAKIHAALTELGWGDEEYYSALLGQFGVGSKTMLSIQQLDAFIQTLRAQLARQGKVDPSSVKWGWGTEKYEPLRGRSGDYAAPEQLRKVEACWRDIARNPSDEALQEFVSNHVGVDHVIWLKREHVHPVLVALKEMGKAQGIDIEQYALPDPPARSNGDQTTGDDRSPKGPTREQLGEMTQRERVLWHLKNEGPLTPREAETKLGVGRLAARIHELRKEGHPIDTNDLMVENQFGKESTVAQYELKTENNSR